jgi:hypothetical protein
MEDVMIDAKNDATAGALDKTLMKESLLTH